MARRGKKERVASLHEEAYQRFVGLLVARRKASGKSQQQVADAIGWSQSVIARIESAQRRLDVVELLRLADAIGFDANKLLTELRKIMVEEGELDG